jgi:hypothetical protein
LLIFFKLRKNNLGNCISWVVSSGILVVMEFVMSSLIRLFAVIALSLLLYACGGDSAWNGTGAASTDDTSEDTTDDSDEDTEDSDGDTKESSGSTAPDSLEFVSANPANIGIKGFGLTGVSKITFKLVDENGSPIEGLAVDFSLNVSAGGVSLAPASSTTDADGLVSTDVTSGTVATVATVRATLQADTDIYAVSDGLIISTGIADQNSMSVGVETINVAEAIEKDGIVVEVSVYAADHFNNPVPDGTAISFTTEGGQIQSGCFTEDGGCSVNWVSSNPRPSDGRITILATMVGEESFLDANGNGVLDGDDPNPIANGNDMSEAFLDSDEDGVFDLGSEEFVDINENATYDSADGEFNGLLCCDSAAVAAAVAAGDGLCLSVSPTAFNCSSSKNISVRGYGLIVMSGDEAYFSYSATSLDVSDEPQTVSVLITDVNGNPMAKGTTIDLSATNGVITSSTSYTVKDKSVAVPYKVTVEADSTAGETGKLKIKVTTPTDNVTSSAVVTIID